jgi:hypothetical protein
MEEYLSEIRPRPLEFLLAFFPVLYGVYHWQDAPLEEAPQHNLPSRALNSGPDWPLTFLFAEPRVGTLGQLNAILERKRNHGFPKFAEIAAMKFQIDNVTGDTTAITMESPRRVKIEARSLILVVRQWAASAEPSSPAKWFKVRVAASDFFDGNRIADGFTALPETVCVVG